MRFRDESPPRRVSISQISYNLGARYCACERGDQKTAVQRHGPRTGVYGRCGKPIAHPPNHAGSSRFREMLSNPMTLEGRRIAIRGTVQGVGFRPWVYRLAQEEGIGGRVRNDPQGVTIEAFGSGPAMEAFLRRLADSPPAAARVRHLRAEVIPAEPADAFVIVESTLSGDRRVSIPPDL